MCNTGKIERVIRVVAGAAIIGWGVMSHNWLGAIGAVPLITGLAGWCPIYAMLGISTGCKTANKED